MQRRLHLQQRLPAEDRQRLLEARDLLLALGLALPVGHCLCLALRLQLVQVSQHRVQLLRRRRLVLLVVTKRDLELLHLAGLALHVALLRGLGHSVLLGQLVVRRRSRRLVRLGIRQQLREVRLRDFQHRHDGRPGVRARTAELRLRGRDLDEGCRAVVVLRHADRLRNRGRRVLEVLRRLQVLSVLLLAHLRRLRLAGIDLSDLSLERLDVLRELRLVGLCLRDAGRRLVKLASEIRLLRLRLTDLLIAERLLVGLLRRLLRQLRDHVLDEAADLAERVRASARRQLHQRVAVELLRETAQHANRLGARVGLLLFSLERPNLRRRLKERLHTLRQDLLRLLDRRRLFADLLLARSPLGLLGLATLLQLLEVLRVSRQRLLRLRELLLGGVELLLGRRPRLRRLAQLLLRHSDLVLEALLEHRVRVLRLHLSLARAAQGLLRLALHVPDGVEDSAALGRVRRRCRLRLERQVLIALLRLRLQQRLDHALLVRVHPRRLHDLLKPAGHGRQRLRSLARLHEAEVLLQHRRGALQRVDRVHKLLLRGGEVAGLLVADVRGAGQVGLLGGDLLGQLIDRCRESTNRSLRVLDRRLQVADRALRARDGVLLRIRLLVAPRRVLLHHARLVRQVRLHLALQLVKELDHLLHRGNGSGTNKDAQKRPHRQETIKLGELANPMRAQTLEP